MVEVEIYTDGACSPNPGTGGWGVVIRSTIHEGKERELLGAEPETTNNRMEMMAAVRGLQALTRGCHVRVVTDSTYVRNGFTRGWLDNWKRNGWKTSAGQAVKNEDLWRELDTLAQFHTVEWQWIKGHAGHPLNERADQLAVTARLEFSGKTSAEGSNDDAPAEDDS